MLRLLLGVLALLLPLQTSLAEPAPEDWSAVVEEARGQTVYLNAWGGSTSINSYLAWAGSVLEERYGVRLVHVKLDDTANAVAKVIAEKAAGQDQRGSVDLIWINGENFASMKRQGLLLPEGWATRLPNWGYVDLENKPTTLTDFTIPVEGLASPWGMAKLVFFHDSARSQTAEMPRSAAELLAWARANPGRFSYPQPPDFIGTSFLKQVLIELTKDRAALLRPVVEEEFADTAQPLFDYLDELTPLLWRQGRAYPQNYPSMVPMLADGELSIIFAFNPSEASAAVARGELPDTIRSFTFTEGTLANTHFLTIPYNASARAAALVVADFMLSAEAQARKQDPVHWGDPTVLAMDKLSPDDRSRFEEIELGVATLAPDELGPALDEPHPSWMDRLELEWMRRYGVAN